MKKYKQIINSEKALGYVESLVSIAVSGMLMVVVALLAARTLRATVRNELQTTATQQSIMYLALFKALQDNGWSTEDGSFPAGIEKYELCYDSTNGLVLCDAAAPSGAILNPFPASEYERTFDVSFNSEENLVDVTVVVNCLIPACNELSATQTQSYSLVNDTADIDTNFQAGVDNDSPWEACPDVGDSCNDVAGGDGVYLCRRGTPGGPYEQTCSSAILN